ncbi:hypothetical protein ACFVGY_01635 [Streptomyces sp. NPDC127106]|uniref:hypothetical protein n=1 Tax=Streptomyces sp. NPDC127106 TaxID=3345360 RepID=UPI0036375584
MHRPPGVPDEDTIELFLPDVDARAEVTALPAAATQEERPVFVDSSGRRQLRVRRVGYVLVVPAAAYVVLLVSTLLGGPTIESPLLPSAQAPHSPAPGDPTAGTPGPTRSATSGSPRPAPAAARSSTPPASGGTDSPRPGTGPDPTKAAAEPGDTAPTQPGGHGRGRTAPPGQGGGKPTAHP